MKSFNVYKIISNYFVFRYLIVPSPQIVDMGTNNSTVPKIPTYVETQNSNNRKNGRNPRDSEVSFQETNESSPLEIKWIHILSRQNIKAELIRHFFRFLVQKFQMHIILVSLYTEGTKNLPALKVIKIFSNLNQEEFLFTLS